MLPRLPYRIQIPLGLAVAVTVAVLLTSAVTARLAARTARSESLATLQRSMDLLVAQGRPLLIAEDTWHAYALLRNVAALLPNADKGLARAALLDADGRILAGSDPARLPTGDQALGVAVNGRVLPRTQDLQETRTMDAGDGSLARIQPIRSDDEKTIGYVFAEVDASAFAPDWVALARPALIGAALAVLVLVPLGWLIGRRMARPVADMANCIAQIGRVDLNKLRQMVPQVDDPELKRIAGAVRQLLEEMLARQANEQRALSAERLAAIGRITAAVAHEINNPLAGLLTATQTLRLHGASPDTQVRTVGLLERGLDQIHTITAALLPQARVEDRCLSAHDFDDVITLARATAHQHGITVSSELQLHSDLLVPSSLFRQVMLNLLLNAIKAAGENGQVFASLHASRRTVRFTITNTGHVLSSDELQRRLNIDEGQSQDPHGFGLWICQEFAVRYGGGLAALDTCAVRPPFRTCLNFWLPNRLLHDDQKPAVD